MITGAQVLGLIRYFIPCFQCLNATVKNVLTLLVKIHHEHMSALNMSVTPLVRKRGNLVDGTVGSEHLGGAGYLWAT